MMKFILMLMFMFFLLLSCKKLIQLFYQNLLFMMMFMFMINMPLNNNMIWVKIYYFMGYDYYSFGLIMLSIWVISLMVMISLSNFINLYNNYYFIIINLMLFMLIMCFMSMNMMMFYLFFESSLIPIFLLILGWGYQIDRIQAGFYMMLYTLFGSLPLFFLIIYIYVNNYSLMMMILKINLVNSYMYMMMMMAFFIKMPMYMLHLWLPKAHVEAPLTGSMILAGVMLKMGSYGILRFMLIFQELSMKFNKFLIIISLMGGIYSSLICLFQVDMKMLVAYSSVVHMSLMMSGMMTLFNLGYLGGLMMMISHGLCSSGLFCLVNINYERLFSRSLLINKGMINYYPSLGLMWFLLCSSNLSFPPSLNLFSEIMLINSLIMWNKNLIYIMMLILFLGASYSLYLYSFSQHGNFNLMIYLMKSVKLNEFFILLLHWIPLNLMFLMMYIFY